MISIDQALQHVIDHSAAKDAERQSLGDALGYVLAEDVHSDVDSPPHDKSIVDGYAVRSADFAVRCEHPQAVELQVIEEVTAGNVPSCEVTAGTATRIMTGAPIPAGADAVVMVEQTQWQQERGLPLGSVRFTTSEVVAQQNIVRRATSLRRGQVVLQSGKRIRPAEIGLLAEVGRDNVLVVSRPHVAVLPTGDELVDVGFRPAPGKIRNTNGPLLVACGRQAGADVTDLGIGRDNRQQLRELIGQGLAADVLVVSGGVSAGKLDLVPGVLAELGVREVFHKIDLKPGKPLWFGVARESAAGSAETLVFGLPGNPVSSYVCFQLFVRLAIDRLGGATDTGHLDATSMPSAVLARSFDVRGDRTTYHPAGLEWTSDGLTIDPVTWHGSGDARALVESNALAIFPPGTRQYEAGQRIRYRPLD